MGTRGVRPVINIIPNCPVCGTRGRVMTPIREILLRMECPSCRHHWLSMSGICPDCENVNHFSSDGLCVKCYEKRLIGGISHA